MNIKRVLTSRNSNTKDIIYKYKGKEMRYNET